MLIKIYAAVTAVMGVVTFAAYGIDKAKAKAHKWRIPESALLLLSFFGGSAGAFLGMRFFHHKTKKAAFAVSVPIMLALWLALGGYIIYRNFI